MAIKGKTEDGTVFINNNNNSNGNFISVFESTIVNLVTYRQFTIGCLRLNYKK